MNLRRAGTQFMTVLLVVIFLVSPVKAQSNQSSAQGHSQDASKVSAEIMAGHGHAVSAGATSSSMDLFTHISNDAVITSASRDFEIASGAQMQFMVSAKGQK